MVDSFQALCLKIVSGGELTLGFSQGRWWKTGFVVCAWKHFTYYPKPPFLLLTCRIPNSFASIRAADCSCHMWTGDLVTHLVPLWFHLEAHRNGTDKPNQRSAGLFNNGWHRLLPASCLGGIGGHSANHSRLTCRCMRGSYLVELPLLCGAIRLWRSLFPPHALVAQHA